MPRQRRAEVAGVSIGTLYQYFPDKAAVLDALAERDGGRVRLLLRAVLASPERLAPARRQAIEDAQVRLVVGFVPA